MGAAATRGLGPTPVVHRRASGDGRGKPAGERLLDSVCRRSSAYRDFLEGDATVAPPLPEEVSGAVAAVWKREFGHEIAEVQQDREDPKSAHRSVATCDSCRSAVSVAPVADAVNSERVVGLVEEHAVAAYPKPNQSL